MCCGHGCWLFIYGACASPLLVIVHMVGLRQRCERERILCIEFASRSGAWLRTLFREFGVERYSMVPPILASAFGRAFRGARFVAEIHCICPEWASGRSLYAAACCVGCREVSVLSVRDPISASIGDPRPLISSDVRVGVPDDPLLRLRSPCIVVDPCGGRMD